MKTKLLTKAIALGVLVWLFMAPTQAKAQVMNPYMIMNHFSCPIKLKYTIYSWTLNGCTNPCDVGFIAVPPGPPPTMIPWNPACTGCAVQIEILAIGTTVLTTPIVAGFNTFPLPPHAMGPDPSGCSPSGNIVIDVHPHGADIHP